MIKKILIPAVLMVTFIFTFTAFADLAENGPNDDSMMSIGNVFVTDGDECIADVNGDGVVDRQDAIEMAKMQIDEAVVWLVTCFAPQRPCGDLNGDGVVDNEDALIMVTELAYEYLDWLENCWGPVTEEPIEFPERPKRPRHLERPLR